MSHFQPTLALRLVEVSVYLLPSCIALVRRTEHLGTGFTINLLLGWTVVGWMYSLAWAAFSDRRGEEQGEVRLELRDSRKASARDFRRAA